MGRIGPPFRLLLLQLLPLLLQVWRWQAAAEVSLDYPEGYYPFEQAPARTPPTVRKPPYYASQAPCPGLSETPREVQTSLNNLCGDLNLGFLPANPLGQNVLGHSYPFELIRNQTLVFLSKTLPLLKRDKTLPKVAKFESPNLPMRSPFRVLRRPVRSVGLPPPPTPATLEETKKKKKEAVLEGRSSAEGRSLKKALSNGARSFCENNWGIFCLLYNTMSGTTSSTGDAAATERKDLGAASVTAGFNTVGGGSGGGLQPLTPCPSAIEYVTPVFARNYQGVWRYVVQIPYEGYFTQTVEVTQCLSNQCHYLSGACLASPRWVSLLVAEIFYPNAKFPTGGNQMPDFSRAAVSGQSPPGRPFSHRSGPGGTSSASSTSSSRYCDGHDDIGCFQVRLYYDWFLIPGSCKCWKQDYFAQFAYKK